MHIDDIQNPTPDLTKIIDQVRRLQALANKNQNENELRAALLAANKIIEQYRLTQAQIEARSQVALEVKMVKQCVTYSKKRLSYWETVLFALCKTYGGSFFMQHSKRLVEYVVCAREEDFDVIEYLFMYVCEEMERLSKKWTHGKGLAYALSWRNGVADGIAEQFTKILAERKEALRLSQSANDSNCAALVVLDNRCKDAGEWMRKQVGPMRDTGRLGGASNFTGYNEGRSVGRNMDLTGGREASFPCKGNGVTQDFSTPNKQLRERNEEE